MFGMFWMRLKAICGCRMALRALRLSGESGGRSNVPVPDTTPNAPEFNWRAARRRRRGFDAASIASRRCVVVLRAEGWRSQAVWRFVNVVQASRLSGGLAADGAD